MDAPPVRGPDEPIFSTAAPASPPSSPDPLSFDPPHAAKVNTIANASAMTINFFTKLVFMSFFPPKE
jgi:hypothetical protein